MLEKIEAIAGAIGSQRHLRALRDGILLSMPLIIIGSFFLILGNLPINGYTDWLAKIELAPVFNKIVNGSFGLMAIIAVFGIARSLADHYEVDGVSAGVVALASFVIVTPDVVAKSGSGIPYAFVGSGGLFVAILIGLISAEIFRFFVQKNFTIKMPEGVPVAVEKSFAALIPGFMVILVWSLVYLLLGLAGVDNIHTLLTGILGKPLGALGSSLWGTLIIIALNSLFWFVGIHGANTINPVIQPIWLQNTDANRIAFQTGHALPHIVTNEFMMNFVWMGGGGTTIGLVICLWLFARSKNNKAMGSLSVAPGVFNINEPVLFGLPVVLNFKLLIPFVLTPMITAVITYFSMATGLVAKPAGIVVPWTMPPVISGYLATGGKISGAVIQLITLALSVGIYYPFVRSMDKAELRNEPDEQQEPTTKDSIA
ncbi:MULTISPECIES: PTS cellobiose transporter subunit IIC [Heyndrickxia]|uniref:PTS cellobiose transporter subunit IIC n=1 Tax=Heyndrickxia TaxID=2837504 RepID=UPI000552A1C3|nr:MULTISPECIES: PTS cellobiose transporter subunit IIC [Heyndrickxia]KGT38400.1 PTS cellobiose transporter subunit IIC [Heyndrickxia coagulans P38]KYC83104.1 PTS system, cellobiose-specific IIC component [Heyndrickxia coagulans]MED4321297.1 PTS cellobiose transporter subunit IIC [Weizmannia sp. CD-2023]MED4839377.1 PTS cellobiose transporter subunit IIC [Weizmannia sp. CD-2023]MED4901960.1 PTS cellobiose transporter subunit IIC [Weizmannia sp. CD-2023]